MGLILGNKIGIGKVRQATNSNPSPTIPLDQVNLLDLGLSGANIDNRLIYLSSLGLTLQVIDIRGNSPRTSASDVAVLLLTNQLNEVWEDQE